MGVQESLLSVGVISPGTNQNLITYIFVHDSNAKHDLKKITRIPPATQPQHHLGARQYACLEINVLLTKILHANI